MSGIDLRQVRRDTASSSVEQTEKGESGLMALLNRDITLGKSKFGDRQKERFYGELQTLLGAGIDIRTALELLESEAVKKEEQKIFKAVATAVVNGSTLPEALKATGYFSEYEYYSMRIGEETGRMQEVLTDLASFYTKKIKQRRKVTSALSYPLLVMGVAFGAVWFMLRFVVPMFAEMLARFGTELPALTKMIIALSDGFGKYGPWIFIVLAGTVFFMMTQRKQVWYRAASSALVMRIPYLGKIVQDVYLERFCQAMHLLMSARTPLVQALELVEKMIGFYPIEQAVVAIKADILKGESLQVSMGRFPIFPRRLVSLIRVAEEVNQLDMMFGKLSKQLTEDIEHKTSILGSVIEPVMIVFLGVLVAVILVAMYLPMFQLSTSFQ